LKESIKSDSLTSRFFFFFPVTVVTLFKSTNDFVLNCKEEVRNVSGERTKLGICVRFLPKYQLGAVAYTCNPSTLGDQGGQSPEVRSSRPAWQTWQKPISTKNTKIRWEWWWAPLVPATWEAETGELLEPGRPRLQ
uniref:Uncharacterized protein n=1 Tax=Macaca mulatta TaxID=9544 RepID=A0A5F8AT82_MACMU